MSEPGEVVRNYLAGRKESAGNNALDFLLGPAHMVLPESVLPHFAGPDDKLSGGELVGLHEPGWGKTLADIGIGTVTDPLSLLTFGKGKGIGVLGKTIAGAGKTLDPLTVSMDAAKGLGNKGIDLADQLLGKSAHSTVATTPVRDYATKLGAGFRSATGWQDILPEAEAAMDAARGTGHIASSSGTSEVARMFQGVNPAEEVALGQYLHQIHIDPALGAQVLPADKILRMQELQKLHPDMRPAVMDRALGDMDALSKTQTKNAMGIGAIAPGPITPVVDQYLARQHTLPMEWKEGSAKTSSQSSFEKARTLKTPQELVDFINDTPGAQTELNARKLMMDRAAGQGRLIERAALKNSVIQKYPQGLATATEKANAAAQAKALANGTAVGKVDVSDTAIMDETLKHIAEVSPDTASRLHTALYGMEARGNVTQLLATVNSHVKPIMVSGAVIPKVGSILRNRFGMPMQAIAEEGANLGDIAKLANPATMVNDVLHGLDDAYAHVWGKKFLPTDKLSAQIGKIEDALKNSKGDMDAVNAALANDPTLLEAVNHGVLDGYVNSEQLLKKSGASGMKKMVTDIYNAPSEAFQVVEQRGRLSYYLNLRARGVAAAKAAKDSAEAFYRYPVTSEGNRTLRDVIPFAQFMLKAIPQQAKFLSRVPAAAIALNPLFANDPDHPVNPYMQDQSRIAIGKNEDGAYGYLTGFGLPVEALNSIPMSGQDISRKIVGATQPLLKTGISAITGIDPYFQTPFGTYDKAPLTGEHSTFGKYYNMSAGTGLIEPIAGPLRMLQTAINPKHGIGTRAVDLFSGAHISDVDEDLANRQIIDNALKGNSAVVKYSTYYQPNGQHDPEVDALIHGLADAKARIKAKQAAAATL
jgi:hypothetical protein